eukprot:TRINITY_DN73516_c0_g1_i1.p1 TRINITY_DN73516_c0_g1~~TRINITY_DN73516_c0_g1_i1.p1  ORF type:complete len:446 (+),score=23.28 TRINITY_DN73516_c0_g1_i1:201-1340(+)
MRHFNKPWFQNWFMFWGEFALLPIYLARRVWNKRHRRLLGKPPKLGSQVSPSVFILPAFCDLFGTGLSCVGVMYVPAAVASMVKGSLVIFSAIMSVAFLKKHLMGFHYVALCITAFGLFLVSYAAVKDAGEQSTGGGTYQSLVGICMVLIGVLCNAFQFVFEEHLLSGKQVSAELVVGLEGFWGVIINGILLVALAYLPGADNGAIQSGSDTLTMISGANAPALWTLLSMYVCCTSTSQICGMTITKKLSAVTRCLISNLQVILVWFASLALYYSGDEAYGTPWTANSWFQLAGFALMVYGTLIYNEVFKIPGLSYMQDFTLAPFPALWSPKAADAGGLPNWESPGALGINSPPSPGALRTPLIDEEYQDTIIGDICLS